MNGYNNVPSTIKPGRPWMIIAAVALILTTTLIIGIKFFVGSEAQDSTTAHISPTDFNFQGEKTHAPGYSPVSRAETGSVGSLEMFAKTNAGYSTVNSSSTESGAVTAPKAKKSAVSQKGAKNRSSAASLKRTVIPKMQVTGFGAAGTGTSNTTRGMPDMATMMKQMQQKQGK